MKKNKKGALNISFAWLFAIIVGAFVLFLAIYISIKVVGIGQTQTDVTASKEIGILLEPLETGFESGKTSTMTFPAETRIYNLCDNEGNFGEQSIKVSQQSFNKWSDTDVNSIFYNKYIFSDSIAEGKKFYLFSMPFDYPFKISDLIFLTSKEYCFMDAPSNVKKELPVQENIRFKNCSLNSIKVCFEKDNCEINVNYNLGYVDKSSLYERDLGEKTEDNTRLYFTGNLMYAAIFSGSEVYNCQTKRLMQRTEQLSSLYIDKINFMKNRCQSDLGIDLLLLKNSAKSFEKSEDFILSDSTVNELKSKNVNSECPIF